MRHGWSVRPRAFSITGAASFETHRSAMLLLGDAAQDEVIDPHREEHGDAARLEPRGRWMRDADQRLNKGFPNKEGARSSRNSSSWALPPMPRPDALLSGTIASTAICQVTAT